MAWKVYAERLETLDATPPYRVFQTARFPKDTVLKAIRTWIIFYNLPVFSGLKMRLYRECNGGLGDFVAETQTLWERDQITTKAGAIAELYFEFQYAPSVSSDDTYYFVLVPEGYNGNAHSHISWVRGIPDPVYDTGVTPSLTKAGEMPFKVSFYGDVL